MLSCTYRWSPDAGWVAPTGSTLPSAQLVLAFGRSPVLSAEGALAALRQLHADAIIVSASAAGAIAGDLVLDRSASALALHFDATKVHATDTAVLPGEATDAVAARLLHHLPGAALVHVLVFADGASINGAQLASSLAAALPPHVSITGGMAGGDARMRSAMVGTGVTLRAHHVVAVGLYGDRLRVGYGSVGGWDPFGPWRRVTAARGNVVHTLDGEPALALYKRYLGAAADELPASALHFPLAICRPGDVPPVVRSVMAIDDDTGALTFGGDIAEGTMVRLMRATHDRLIEGAEQAAMEAQARLGTQASAAILVSCVGRRRVLRQRVEDEIDGVRAVLGPVPAIAGFYSHGEIASTATPERCELHNQTMTVTVLAEA